ncbi:MAG TPA: Tox-REase-5 domain-containing protein [Myxococcaceae bacterium]|nr:Tox-REase-5 domain-containing protein [Myxococcaceae bacterium]
MSRAVRAVSSWLFLVLASCGTLGEETRPTPPGAARTVVVPHRAGRPPVGVSEEELRAAFRVLVEKVRLPVRFGSRRSGLEVLPASGESLAPWQLAMARDYRLWCERRHPPSDCLELLRSRPVLGPEGRYTVAFDIALGSRLDGFTDELRGMADPAVVRLVLLGAMVTYMGLLAFPELVTKGVAAAVTVVLTAYLGAQMVWNLVAGWIRMVHEADAAKTFTQLRDAGERYGRTIGAETARLLVMVVTAAIAEGGLVARVFSLPRAQQAAVALAADTGGKLDLAAVGQVNGVTVGELGVTVVLAPAAEGVGLLGVAMAAKAPRGVESATIKPAPKKKEPGQWKKAKSPAKGRAGKYQQQVTGHPPDEVYMVEDVEFDGYLAGDDVLIHVENGGGVLLDAKGKGYQRFFKDDLSPQKWFKNTGMQKLLDQASRQVEAARGIRIRWHVAEEKAAAAIKKLLFDEGFSSKIEVVHTPMQ